MRPVAAASSSQPTRSRAYRGNSPASQLANDRRKTEADPNAPISRLLVIINMAEGKRDLMDRQTAAVIGAGVSGLTAAYILQKKFDVTLFEADSRLGGHVDTRDVADLGPIDLGFLSYNEASHSSITRLFGELGVESRPANMSGDVVCSDCHFAVLALPPSGLSTVPARPDNVDDASWKRCVDDVARFGRDVLQSGEAGDPAQTLGAFLAAGSYSEYFVRHYIYPLIGGWHL